MQQFLYQTVDVGLYQTADAGDTLSDRRCRNLSLRQQMMCLFIGQRMQETLFIRCRNHTENAGLYQAGDAGLSLSDSRRRTLFNR